MDGARGGEYNISKPRWSNGKMFAPGSLIFSESVAGFSVFSLSGGSAKLRLVGPVAHVGEA
jgi:hypothetical protein